MTTRSTLVGAVLACLSSGAFCQGDGSVDWAVTAGGPGADYVYDVVVLPNDNNSIVITGEFWKQITFPTLPSSTTLTTTGPDSATRECDMFVAKYSAQGTCLWAKKGGGKFSDRGLRARDIGSGQVKVIGTCFGNDTAGDSTDGVTFGNTILDAPETSYWEAVYNLSDGSLASASLPTFGQTSSPLMQPSVDLGAPNWMIELASGDMIRTGRLLYAEKFDATTTLTVVNSSGDETQSPEDMLLVRRDSAGDLVWAKSAGGLGKDWGTAVAARSDGVGGVVVVGNFEKDATFGSKTLTVSGAGSESEIFVAKYRLTSETTATFESIDSEDGYVVESTESSGVGGTTIATGDVGVGDGTLDKQCKGFFSFDTSSIPDNVTIASATLKCKVHSLHGSGWTTLGTLYVDVQSGGFGANTALESGDFQASATATQVATLPAATVGNLSTGTLSPAGRDAINKTGKTQFRVYFSLDDDDDGGTDGPGFWPGVDGSSTADEPILEVVYY